MAEWDIPNWISLVVEIGVAIFAIVISLNFYKRGKEQQEKASKALDEIKKFTENESGQKKDRRKQLLKEFEMMRNFLIKLPENSNDDPDTNFIETFEVGKEKISTLIDHYSDIMTAEEKWSYEGLREYFEGNAKRDHIGIDQIDPMIHHMDSCYLEPIAKIYSKKFSDNSSL